MHSNEKDDGMVEIELELTQKEIDWIKAESAKRGQTTDEFINDVLRAYLESDEQSLPGDDEED